jgi:hypothetical protein
MLDVKVAGPSRFGAIYGLIVLLQCEDDVAEGRQTRTIGVERPCWKR